MAVIRGLLIFKPCWLERKAIDKFNTENIERYYLLSPFRNRPIRIGAIIILKYNYNDILKRKLRWRT